MSWVIAIGGLCVLIVLHEFGHFIVAKSVGMRVERFSLFFPPTILKFRRGETEYALGAIPAGGYVKISGMNPTELENPINVGFAKLTGAVRDDPTCATPANGVVKLGDLTPAELDRAQGELKSRMYYAQPPWKRIAVILAGPAMNLLITFFVFWALLLAGSSTAQITLENLVPSVATLLPSSAVGALDAGSPAARALHLGDRILAVDGKHGSVAALGRDVAAHHCAGVPKQGCRASTPARITVRRHGRVKTLSIYPRYEKAYKRTLVGFSFGVRAAPFGVLSAAHTSVDEMWHITTQSLSNFVHAFTSSKVRHQLSSIVGITQDTQQAVNDGPGYALVLLAFISLALAIINLFPFLPLDGGHILWSVAEKLRRRRISIQAMFRFSSIGIIALVFIVISAFSNDISRLGG